MGIFAICTCFGVEGNPRSHHAVHLALGRAIWGDHPAFEVSEVTPDRLRAAITAQYNPEQWAAMTCNEKGSVEIYGLKLKAIARVFGVEGSPCGYRSVHLALGRAIWGEHAAWGDIGASS